MAEFRGLARKYRPSRFSEVVGQEHVTRTLRNALRLGRPHHAYVFSGPRGIGKTTIARILAKSLNCPDVHEGEPCNKCPVCREIDTGSSVDVMEIDGASYTQVDNVREIQEVIRYSPARGRYRVVIIDEFHMLSRSAFNALLKTIEEPPPHVVFIFATTEPHRVPDTVMSRCHRFDFRPIPSSLILQRLQEVTTKEGIDVEPGALESIVREAGGSLRDALSLFEQVASYSGGRVSREDVEKVLGIPPAEAVTKILSFVVDGKAKEAVEQCRSVLDRGVDAVRLARDVLAVLRDALIVREGGKPAAVWSDEFSRIVGQLSAEDFITRYRVMLGVLEDIQRSPVPDYALEVGLVKLARLPRLQSVADVVEMLRSANPSGSIPLQRNNPAGGDEPLTGSVEDSAKEKAEKPKSAGPGKSVSTRPSPGDFESQIIGSLSQRSRVTAELLSKDVVEVLVEGGTVTIKLKEDSPLLDEEINAPRIRAIEDSVKELLGHHVDLILKSASRGKSDYARDAETKILNDPVLEKFISSLGARVININKVEDGAGA